MIEFWISPPTLQNRPMLVPPRRIVIGWIVLNGPT